MELTAALLLLFLLLALALDRAEMAGVAATSRPSAPPLPTLAIPRAPSAPDPLQVVVPYADPFWVTQGHHGFSYGHLAIDIAAGKGSVIVAPINGTVTGNYVDVYGNTTLLLENERYRVTLLHGDYLVAVGAALRAGAPVGTESNHGYTTDMQGRSCRGRECGYHTHLNIFDKVLGQNVSPLKLLSLTS